MSGGSTLFNARTSCEDAMRARREIGHEAARMGSGIGAAAADGEAGSPVILPIALRSSPWTVRCLFWICQP